MAKMKKQKPLSRSERRILNQHGLEGARAVLAGRGNPTAGSIPMGKSRGRKAPRVKGSRSDKYNRDEQGRFA